MDAINSRRSGSLATKDRRRCIDSSARGRVVTWRQIPPEKFRSFGTLDAGGRRSTTCSCLTI